MLFPTGERREERKRGSLILKVLTAFSTLWFGDRAGLELVQPLWVWWCFKLLLELQRCCQITSAVLHPSTRCPQCTSSPVCVCMSVCMCVCCLCVPGHWWHHVVPALWLAAVCVRAHRDSERVRVTELLLLMKMKVWVLLLVLSSVLCVSADCESLIHSWTLVF